MAETVRKNLGMVTAYAYAVSKGYSGTEEEFAELMASYADVAQDAEASAQAAAQSATTAEQKATQAAGSATNAAGSATSASESAQAAAGSSNSASLYAQNASASATNAAGSASSASTYAGNASASAQDAESSANAAQASATQAAGSATTATAKAGEAATSATTAAEAAQRAEDAAATLVIDDTLTHAGQAADAKKTGDEIGDLKENLNEETDDKTITDFVVVVGEQVMSTTGAITENTNAARSDYIPTDGATGLSFSTTGYLYNYVFYDADKKYISGSTTFSNPPYLIPVNAEYMIFSGQKDATASKIITLHNARTFRADVYKAISEKTSPITVFDQSFLNEKILLKNIIGINKFPGNLVIITDCVDNQYVNTNDGNITYNQPNYFRTGYIPVTAGKTYRANHGRNLAWYDSNYNYISGMGGVSIQTGVTAPENAAFIRFTINKASDGISSPIELYFTDTDTYDTSVKIDGLVVSNVKPWCYGKKINWIGDSIVDGPDFDEQVCSAVGLVKESEYGINGSTFALNADGTNTRNALCERYTSMSDDADIIAVSCGTNDWMYAWSPVGTIESTENTTFYGALKTLCQGLIDKYPQKLIFFTTPIKRAQAFADGAGGEYTADGVNTTPFSKNKYGKTLGDYADIIKEVCGYYSIPVLDMYRESLLNPHIASQQNMFDNVLTHPNAIGQKIMARRIAGWISQLGYVIDGLNN